jgi:hypothetical protein
LKGTGATLVGTLIPSTVGSLEKILDGKKTISLLTDPGFTDNKLWLAPKNYNKEMYGQVGLKGQDSKWHIAQWGILEELPAETIFHPNFNIWGTKNSYAKIRIKQSYFGNVIELTQDSSDPNFGCNEFDLLLEVNELRAYPNVPEGRIPIENIPTLDKINNLNMKLWAQVVYASHGSRCGNGEDLASTGLGLVFENSIKNQYLFYQIITYDSRPNLILDKSWFSTNLNSSNYDKSNMKMYGKPVLVPGGKACNGIWFPTTPYYGVSDLINFYDKKNLVPGGKGIFYNFDVSNRIKELIEVGPSEEYLIDNQLSQLDKDLNHWKPVGFYYGSYTNGEGKVKSRLASIDVLVNYSED